MPMVLFETQTYWPQYNIISYTNHEVVSVSNINITSKCDVGWWWWFKAVESWWFRKANLRGIIICSRHNMWSSAGGPAGANLVLWQFMTIHIFSNAYRNFLWFRVGNIKENHLHFFCWTNITVNVWLLLLSTVPAVKFQTWQRGNTPLLQTLSH